MKDCWVKCSAAFAVCISASLLIAACSKPPVESAHKAIAIGSQVCTTEWQDYLSRNAINLKPEDWNARLYNGDRWDVWVMGTRAHSKLDVIVLKSGEPATQCAMYGKFQRSSLN